MKRLIIFSFFIILNTMAMKPDFNARDNEIVSTCRSLNNYIADVHSEMVYERSIFAAYHLNVEKIVSSLENIFNNYDSYRYKLWKIFEDFLVSDSSEFVSYFLDLKDKSEDLHKELEDCIFENISLKTLFLDNKESFDNNCEFIYKLSINEPVSFSDSDYKVFNLLDFLLEKNKGINESLRCLIWKSFWIGEKLNTIVNESIKIFYDILEKDKKINEDVCRIECEGILLSEKLNITMYSVIRFLYEIYKCEN